MIDPMLFEKSYYLEPEKSGAKPYALLRQALLDADRMAVVTVALRQRTSVAVLRVRDDVIVLQTMMWPDEVRQPDFSVEPGEIKDAEVKMAHLLVETLAGDFDAGDFEDDYAGAVEALVKAKIDGVPVFDCHYGTSNNRYSIKIDKLLTSSPSSWIGDH